MNEATRKAVELSADMCAYFCRCMISNGIPYKRAVPMTMKFLELVINNSLNKQEETNNG